MGAYPNLALLRDLNSVEVNNVAEEKQPIDELSVHNICGDFDEHGIVWNVLRMDFKQGGVLIEKREDGDYFWRPLRPKLNPDVKGTDNYSG